MTIISKRNRLLGNVTQKTASGEPPHYMEYLNFIETGVHRGNLSLSARRAAGQGKMLTREGGLVNYKFEVEGSKKGALLLTTALLYHRTKIGNPTYTINIDSLSDKDAFCAVIANSEADIALRDQSLLGTATAGNSESPTAF